MSDPTHNARGANGPLPSIRFAELAEALLVRSEQLVEQWLSGGVKRGHEWVCGSLSGGAGSSCSVNLTNGRWADFSTGEQGGDLLSLYAAIHGLSQAKAAVSVAREQGLESVAGVVTAAPGGAPPPPVSPRPPEKAKTKPEPEGWRSVVPVPAYAPEPTFKHFARSAADIEHKATYRLNGELHGYVLRFRTSDGGKDTLPYTWCQSSKDGKFGWTWKAFDEPRPLYVPGAYLPSAGETPRTVVLVEGERKGECLQALLDAAAPDLYVVVSWPGGCKAWKKASWEWLAGCSVLLWPDCDAKREPLTAVERKAAPDKMGQAETQVHKLLLPGHKQPGMAAMLGIGALLRDAHGCRVQLLPIPRPGEVVDGWDARDAIEADGWDGARVLAFFGRAQALPEGDAAAPLDAAPGKKIATLVGTGSGDSGDGWPPDDGADCDDVGMVKIGSRMVPDWLACYFDAEKNRWNISRKTVILLLERDPALRGVLAYNELSNNIQARTKWPWQHGAAGDLTDAADLLMGDFLTDAYGLPSITRAALIEGIQTVAHKQRFHPIREYLQGLQWDNTSRIDKWLIYALGETPDKLNPRMVEYLQVVGRCWLLGMVNRVMEPGCKFDYCPVLEGAGGLRKSTLVEVLAGKEYFSDTPFDVGRGKEAQEQVQGLWLYEIAELTHFSKAEVGAIKAFISSKSDRYRVAYGATVSTFPRQCLLVGTTNENTYLRDRTGNRRFWPIPVRNVINTEWVAKYRDQLLAEAFVLYGQHAAYTPTPDQEARLFVPMQESRLVETAVLSELLHVLTRAPQQAGIGAKVNELASFVTIAQLVLALGVDAAKSTPGLEAQIRSWLDHEGWTRIKRQTDGARAWGYLRPTGWPKAEPEGDDMEKPLEAPVEPPSAAPAPLPRSEFEPDDDEPF